MHVDHEDSFLVADRLQGPLQDGVRLVSRLPAMLRSTEVPQWWTSMVIKAGSFP
ncbi:hypothetical protein [Streptomyces xanthophaeus]